MFVFPSGDPKDAILFLAEGVKYALKLKLLDVLGIERPAIAPPTQPGPHLRLVPPCAPSYLVGVKTDDGSFMALTERSFLEEAIKALDSMSKSMHAKFMVVAVPSQEVVAQRG